MTTSQATASVSQQVETLFESVITLGTSLVRLGASAIAIPLSVLPPKAREDAVHTTHRVVTTVEDLHVSAFKTFSRVASAWLHEIDKAISTAAPPPAAAPAQQAVIETPAKAK